MRLTQNDLAGTLRSLIDGSVLTAGDGGYERARTPFFAHRTGHPIVVVRPRHAGDVAAAVLVAAGGGIPLSVRSGGHSAYSTGDGLLLDLGNLTDVHLDPDGRLVWAGSGFTAGDLSHALGRAGLAVGFGDIGSTGIGGLTLGGGIGFLSRRHGLTIDNLLAAEIVTTDGRIRVIDAERDPDLFWAIRGGGGNFGVVTRFCYRTAGISRIHGGLLMLPATPRIVAELTSACAQAPLGLTVIANVMRAPALPFVPPELVGTPMVMARVCWAGPGDATSALRPLRAIAPPVVDLLAPMPYAALLDEQAPDRGMRPAIDTGFRHTIDESAGAVILDHLEQARSPLAIVQIRVLGGAVGAVPAAATAFAHRTSPILLTVVHGDQPDQNWADTWARGVIHDLDQGDAGAYVNFLPPEGSGRLESAYPADTLARLRQIKAGYDPANIFRNNVNITPARPPHAKEDAR